MQWKEFGNATQTFWFLFFVCDTVSSLKSSCHTDTTGRVQKTKTLHLSSCFILNAPGWRPGQRICRSGTQRPCYKASYIHDSRRRLTFEDARQACRLDGGELLSIETESEQQLIERYIQKLTNRDGDFWIGLRRNPQRYSVGTSSPGCPSQYYWLDGSKAKFRFFLFVLKYIFHLCKCLSCICENSKSSPRDSVLQMEVEKGCIQWWLRKNIGLGDVCVGVKECLMSFARIWD